MTGRPIVFEPGRTDVVTAVVTLIDGVTRLPVRGGCTVQLWDPARGSARPARLVRNLSGRFVLLNEPAGQDHVFRIDPAAAGYRGPLLVTINPARDGRERVVALEPRPDAAFDETATIVRGQVVRSATPVPGLTVTARPAGGSAGHQFPATTDARGVFALAVGLKLAGVTDPAPVTTTLRFEKPDSPVREFDVDLEHGRTHVFAVPVDLDRDDQPAFTHDARPTIEGARS